uniref:Uncharacterized protein n=1 Tax=Ditylum brightwellii TaxID=49249 RepID=A0A7S1ZZ31_9STRA
MFALFTYSFLEHIIDDAYVDAINSPDVTTITYASAHDPTLSGAMATIQSLPVWFDVVHSAYGPVLTSAFPMMHTSYAHPALSCAGVAAVTMSSCWIVSGYFTEAFVFSNTLCCDTNNAVVVAGKTYVGAAFLMVVVAVGSHLLLGGGVVGGVDVLDTSSLLTKADVDYIFCSFSVVLFWRYTISWLLGTGS